MASVPISEKCCLTDFLLNTTQSFSSLDSSQKKTVINLGRAKPFLNIIYKRKSGFTMHFCSSYYDKYSWLTGSCVRDKLFCFPCLLFSTTPNVWTQSGFNDINHIFNSANRHAVTGEHIRSCLALYESGEHKTVTSVGNNIEAYNKKVDKNRDLMKRFIDTIIFVGKQELAFGGHGKSGDSYNRGNYVESLSYLAKYDSLLDSHLEQCSSSQDTVFSGLSNDTQNELIENIAEIIRMEIKNEIRKAQYVSVIIDEPSYVSSREQISIVFRYLHANEVKERFVGFFDLSISRDASAIASFADFIAEEYDCKNKLISQSYYGPTIMSDEDDKLQIKNPEMHHIPITVPCYAHALSLDLSRSLENILELKVFFGYINSIVRFLNKSTKISTMFELFSERSITEVTETECHLHSRIVTVVYSLRSDIMQTLNFILTSFENWDNETISQAESLSNTFEDKHFNFLLCVISEIFTKTDTLFNDSENSNVSIDAGAIEDFLSWINFKFVNKLDNFLKEVNDLVHPIFNQRKLHVEMESRSHYKKLLINIKENIMCQIKYRYKSFNKLSFLNLMNKDKYDSFSKLFPEELLNDLVSNFKGVFHFSALKNELNILYTTASLKEKQDIYDIYLHISNDVIKDIFPQLLKLCTIFLTLPIPIASIEKSFSALERIRTYLQNSQSKSRLPISSLISIENKLLLNIRNKPSFYNDVLSEFLKMDHRIALEYK